MIFKIINKSQVRDALKNKPPGQRLYDAFNEGKWDLLTEVELREVMELLSKEFEAMTNEMQNIIRLRSL